MKRFLTPALAAAVLFSACDAGQALRVEVTDRVISSDYVGNGVEWDPYDEAEAWGAEVSDADWAKLSERLDFMRPGYVRCMINSPYRYYDAATGRYDRMRNLASLRRLLQYCQDNGITVAYGEYNPPTWAMKDSQQWVEMSVDYLNFLVCDLGFDCIRHFIIFNEPDGNWASTDGDYDLWRSMAQRFDAEMARYPDLKRKVSLAAPDVVMSYKNPASEYDAAWMLDDAMHSNGDSGRTEDVKIWGMWNILGEEVFGDASQEELRPWYYTWSLMCRHFPAGCDILACEVPQREGLRVAAARKDAAYSVAAVNFSQEPCTLEIVLPGDFAGGVLYRYTESDRACDANGFPAPCERGIAGKRFRTTVPAESFVLLTNVE